MPGLVAVTLLALTLGSAGWWASRGPGGGADSRLFDLVQGLVVGFVLLHLTLSLLDLIAVRWTLPAVVGLLAVGAVTLRLATAGKPRTAPAGRRFDATDGMLLLLLLLYACLCWSQLVSFPDFVYHWGLKAQRYLLAGGIDYDFLERRSNSYARPGYPHAVPGLYAVTSRLAGGYSEPPLLLWSAIWAAMLLVGLREALAQGTRSPWSYRYGRWIGALAVLMFGVSYLLAGSVEWVPAAALVLALPALLDPTAPGRALQVGFAAAWAAGAKIEGVPLAAFVVVAYLVARHRRGGSQRLRAMVAAALPGLLVVLPWYLQGKRHELFDNLGLSFPDPDRIRAVAGAAWQAVLRPEWHFVPMAFLLLPWLLWHRRTRLPAAVITMQLGFFAFRYLTFAGDAAFYVASSLPRLFFQLLPALVVGIVIVVDDLGARRAGSDSVTG